MRPFNSLVSGSILRRASEYLTLAFTQAARGAQARDTFWITDCSKDIGFSCIILFTFFLISFDTYLASKFRMLYITPVCPRNFFIAFQEVSSCPISLRTPCSTSDTASGGILYAFISLMLELLSDPTAALAASTSGWTPLSSSSTTTFLSLMNYSSSEHFFCSCSISYFLSAFSSRLLVMSVMALLASICLIFRSPCCS